MMKTIFIITTREYPIDNTTQFQDISGYYNENNENYITQQEWGDYFRADAWDHQTWVDDNTKNMRVEQPLPIKKGEIEGLVFYVAPCLNKDVVYHNFSNQEYIKKIISAVKKDIKEETYRIILIVHDHDMNDDQPCVHRASGDKMILENKEVKGCISYQHEPPNNKNVKCKEISETISLEYDIYEAFILHLNDVGGITKDKCDKLNKILFQLDLTQEVEEIKVTDCSEITAKNEELERISNSSLQEDEKSNSNNPDSLKILDYDGKINGSEWNYVLGVSFVPVITKLSMPLENLQSNHRYKNVLDSSIWFYAYSNEEELKEIKQQIADNKPRYDLDVAHEYREFYHRMLKNSYTIGSHKGVVSPFLFHSEQELKKKIDEHKQIIDNIKQYKWRILLVDDHVGETKMKLSSGEESTLTKLDVVKTELEKLFKNIATEKDDKIVIIATEEDTEDIKKNANIYIECVSSIKEAKDKLAEKKYEIILLDYLLGEKGDGREYGYELLDWIDKQETAPKGDNTQVDYKKGPDNRFYFMFISAFTTAVSERLLAQGWARNEDYWYIGEGACPINTPYLFQYRLLHIMEKRMKKMGIFTLSKTANDDFKASKIYEDVIAKIFPEDKERGKVRKYANDKFQDVLSLLYHYKNLLVDTQNDTNIFETKESVLATDFVMKNPNLGGLLEHLTQLVYLTAFGTVRQWPEMWEEYQFIKSIVGPIDAIENYIVNLKNNKLDESR